MKLILVLLSLLMFSCHCIRFSAVLAAATSTVSTGQSLTSSDTLVSSGGIFELGFFSPGNSSYRYLGIWYTEIEVRTIVCVGNRDLPLTTSSPALAVDGANLVILDGRITYKLSNNSVGGNASATLLDSGNLVLREDSSEAILWQSFDEPSDTFMPGMKLGYSRKTGKVWALTSWKNATDPSPGDSSLRIDSESPDEFVILKGSQKYWTSGPWDRDSQTFSLVPEMRLNYIFNYSFISNPNEVYFTYSLYSSFGNRSSPLVMDLSGQIRQQTWLEATKAWNLFWSQPRLACDVYKFCGSCSRCNDSVLHHCECLVGSRPSDPDKWPQYDTSAGCVRRIPLQCEQMGYGNGDKDVFLKMDHVTFPLNYKTLEKISNEAFILACSGDCSCTAYAYIAGGTGKCLLWHGDLLNLRQVPEDDFRSETVHIKVAAYELQNKTIQSSTPGTNEPLKVILASVVPLTALVLTTYICCRWKMKQKGKIGPTQDILPFDVDMSIAASADETSRKGIGNEKHKKDAWLPLFSFSSVTAATENFSNSNKLGEGGFGPVYKGKLLRSKHVAVKRLSKKSAQGMLELKNETMLIAKLQHKNLVRLLGCCLERDEKIVIYEYMPNKSLDSFLFDQTKGHLLNWEVRAHIAEGIAQGLVYLHEHSRLRIVHRDLKASNILLDSDMNPKISDFGLAKMFGGNESVANTNRIVGTYGYMSPEYALEGVVSTKSDVFSFGVLLLEILSGKKNTGFYQTDLMNLLGHVWQLWQEDRPLCLVDSALEHHESDSTLMRHINVALLCVQEIAADRPTMSEVLTMLTNELLILPSPKQPAFSYIRTQNIPEPPLYRPDLNSVNDVTVSLMEAR